MSSIVIEFESQAAFDEMSRCVAIADGYIEEIEDPENPGTVIPNPQSRDEFMQSRVIGFLTDKQYHVQLSEHRDELPPPNPGIVTGAQR